MVGVLLKYKDLLDVLCLFVLHHPAARETGAHLNL